MPMLTEMAQHFPLVKATQGLHSCFLKKKKKAYRVKIKRNQERSMQMGHALHRKSGNSTDNLQTETCITLSAVLWHNLMY